MNKKIFCSKKGAFEMSFLVKLILMVLLLVAAIGIYAFFNTKSANILDKLLGFF